jgi:hypothetical protein
MVVLLSFAAFSEAAPKQKTFSSPEAAVSALISALKTNNEKTLHALTGSQGKQLISSGDPVADRNGRQQFVRMFEEKHSLRTEPNGSRVIVLGNDDYPWPIPIAKRGKTWYFDTKAGKEELLNRRIGKNELTAIDVLREYTAAQREFIRKDWNGDGVLEFAQKIASTPGKRDGLYWEAKEGQEESPFGPFIAKAWSEGYAKKPGEGPPIPYHGYYFRILKAQGGSATGGAYDYVTNGQMVLGFAMLAYPAQYGASGVMSFIVNQEGIVYQRDLGTETAKAASAITKFDPDKNWTKVE